MKTTRKDEKNWIKSIILNLPPDLLNSTGDPIKTTADNIRAILGDRSYYKSAKDAALHFLSGCGLHGFPICTEDHAKILQDWGFKATSKNVENFFSVSAGLLIEVLNESGEII